MCGSPEAFGGTAPASLRGWDYAGPGRAQGCLSRQRPPRLSLCAARRVGLPRCPPGRRRPCPARRSRRGRGRGREAAGPGRSGAGARLSLGAGAGCTPEVSGEGRAERGGAGGGKVPRMGEGRRISAAGCRAGPAGCGGAGDAPEAHGVRGQPARWGGRSCCSRCCSRCCSLPDRVTWGDLHPSNEKVLKKMCCIKSALRNLERFRLMLFATFVWLRLLTARAFFSSSCRLRQRSGGFVGRLNFFHV